MGNKTSKQKSMHKNANMILAGSHGIMYLLKQAMTSCIFLSHIYSFLERYDDI